MNSSKLACALTIVEISKLLPPGSRVRFLPTKEVLDNVPANVREGIVKNIVPTDDDVVFKVIVEYYTATGPKCHLFTVNVDVEVIPG